MIKIIGKRTGLGNQIHCIPLILYLQRLGYKVISDSSVYSDLGLNVPVVEYGWGEYNFILYGYNWKKTLSETLKYIPSKSVHLSGFAYRIKGMHIGIGLTRSIKYDESIHEYHNLRRLFDIDIPYIWPGQGKAIKDRVVIAISRKQEKTLPTKTILELDGLLRRDGYDVVIIDKGDELFSGTPTPKLMDLKRELFRAEYVIASDSGAMHLADVMGIPTLALFGPTDEKKNGPLNGKSIYKLLPCRPCYNHGRVKCIMARQYYCMEWTANRIFKEFKMFYYEGRINARAV